MSDHFDALLGLYDPETVSAAIKVTPGMKPPKIDARIDICDIFVFQKPKSVNKSVLVLDVNPAAPTYADSFSSEAVYELKVDTNGDAVADVAYRFTFSPKEDGMQFTGADTFIDKNVFSIVLEIPNSALGNNPKLGIWFRILILKDENPFFQIDRMGRPFVNVVFTKQEDKDTFNRIEPTRDRELFTKKFADLLRVIWT